MTTLRYLKGVRTRFVNTLKREIIEGSELINLDLSVVDKKETLSKVIVSIDKIQTYVPKLEAQSEKVIVSAEENEDILEQIMTEDTKLLDSALQLCSSLKVFEIQLNDLIKSETIKSEIEPAENVELKEIIQLQKELLESKMLESASVKKHSVKLPKLEIHSFYGDRLKWIEFWQSFESSIHANDSLSNIDKFNYLRSKLSGEAKIAIAGLSLSNENYSVAIKTLKDRFGNIQETIDMHYNKIVNLRSANDSVESLRQLCDSVERHLRSLEALGQNVDQDLFVSVLKSKLPSSVLRQLEIRKGSSKKWSIQLLRDMLFEYITACDRASAVKRDYVNGERLLDKNKSQNNKNFSKPVYVHSTKPGLGTALAANVSKKFQNKSISIKCRYCSRNHWSDECPQFQTIDERKGCLQKSCYKCLKEGHSSKECKSRKKCVYCSEENVHHRSLCPRKFKKSVTKESVHVSEEGYESEGEHHQNDENVLLSYGEKVIMQTASAKLYNEKTLIEQDARILLDSGSQRTYITEEFAKKLKLRKENEQEINLSTFGSKQSKKIKTASAKIILKSNFGEEVEITVNIVPNITGIIQRKSVKIEDKKRFHELKKNLQLADKIPEKDESDKIDLLIGNDYYLDIVLGHKIEVQKGLYLLSSKLGWILTGRTGEQCYNDQDTNLLVIGQEMCFSNNEDLNCVDDCISTKVDIENFWKLDSIGINDEMMNSDDANAMKSFTENLSYKEGRYHVSWPWKENNPDLPENRPLAIGRLKSVVKKLESHPELLEKYSTVLKEQLQNGIIEKVTQNKKDGLCHYLPHHAVVKPDHTTTKLRIVYDASAKTKLDHNSLNECLYRGPILLHDLCGTLMRFRTHKIGIVSDIEKAFLQIALKTDQRDVTRFIWLKDTGNTSVDNDNLQEYRFCRVPFGVISSPFLLSATVEHHLDYYNSAISNQLKRDIYMDNVITGVNTVQQAEKLYKESKQMFDEANMNLREWMSNNKQVMDLISVKDKASGNSMKVLGMNWDIESDKLSVKPCEILKVSSGTKRTVLKQVAKLFDPLGMFAPVTLNGKLLLQKLWLKHQDWDDQLDDEDEQLWRKVIDDISKVSEYRINRCVTIGDQVCLTNNLVCFCDASANAYAVCIYLVQFSENRCNSELIFAKTRLAPTTKTTIPRLELLAILIGTRCLEFVQNELELPIAKVFLLSDSQCALKWIYTEKPLSVFVGNRVKEIKRHEHIQFLYVPTDENPADVASRGCSAETLLENKTWWKGPSWLTKSECEWPVKRICDLKDVTVCSHSMAYMCEIETKESKTNNRSNDDVESKHVFSTEMKNAPFELNCENFSSVTKLFRVTALCLRFIKLLKGKSVNKPALNNEEISQVEEWWIKHIQYKSFPEIFQNCSKKPQNNLEKQLGLFIDSNGIIRCKGRLENSNLTESARLPILLPSGDRFTHIIIKRIHEKILHSGVSQTLNALRLKYWVPRGRATVRKVIHMCLICRRTEGGPYKMPKMAPLPKSRVSEAVPFLYTGLDYLGPLYTKINVEIKKVWICLFTCMVTRAIHLEIVGDMTTVSFLNCFRRFIATRGTPQEIVCDNALHFKLASETTNLVWKNIFVSEDVVQYSANQGIKWSFIVELAPWMGGFYERLVSLVKRSLRKTIGRKILTFDQLVTVTKEVEAVVNSRPLVYVGDDINSTIVIMPSYFLGLNPNTGIPSIVDEENDPSFEPKTINSHKMFEIWKKGNKLLDMFWSIWRTEYLSSLRERSKLCHKAPKNSSDLLPTIGSVVLIKDNLPRGMWKLGKIIKLNKGKDGLIRSVKLKTSSGKILGRPLCLLYPLEMTETKEDYISKNDSTGNTNVVKRRQRPAAAVAEKRMKDILIYENI